MWQLLIAAAVAGSTTLVAKLFLGSGPAQPEEVKPDPPCSPPSPQPRPESPDRRGGDGIFFRFSSSGLSPTRKKKEKKNKEKDRLRVTGRLVEASGSGGGRKFVVRLKKRRTSKIAPPKPSSTKDEPLFSWGLGVGMMCMMSAGKTEIGKLSAVMDETSKVVNELRAELCKRKAAQVMASSRRSNAKPARLPLSVDVECPSSVLTEEPEPEVLEMDQLEAELESELKKLPWSTDEASNNGSVLTNLEMAEASTKKFHELEEGGVAYQCNGVGPEELDKRLSRLLIEQQQNQIVELESELNLAKSKLHEKEAELQALKDCVRRLTQFSISNVSDDEDHDHEREQRDFGSRWNSTCEIRSESRISMVGMKRPVISAQ